ncbi:MAG: hypothetical protein EXS08_08640 [Planctomycetes bacterium]|nr:hypothetical protein [Planctomycetota bacterium]
MEHEDLTPDCGRMRNELAGYLYGELALDARTLLEAHLEGCGACREELSGLRETQALLGRWETPPANDDPRELAAAIAARAGQALPRLAVQPRRARLVRWSALLCGAAAALLFLLSVLGTRVSFEGGNLQLSFALPGASAPAPRDTLSADEVQAYIAQQVALHTSHLEQNFEQSQRALYQRVAQMNKEELLRLAQTVDYALDQNQEALNSRLNNFARTAASTDAQTIQALNQLATMTVSNPNHPNR